jgi:ATP synthase F1 complex assembly factor 2
LVLQQRRQWDPLLTWFRQRYDCPLTTTLEIETPQQHEHTVRTQQHLLHCLNGWQLAVLDNLCTVTKSFVISWSLLAERLTVAQAFEAARLEENWQMRAYGKVEGIYGHGIDMEFVRMNINASKTMFNLLQDGPTPPELMTNKPTTASK